MGEVERVWLVVTIAIYKWKRLFKNQAFIVFAIRFVYYSSVIISTAKIYIHSISHASHFYSQLVTSTCAMGVALEWAWLVYAHAHFVKDSIFGQERTRNWANMSAYRLPAAVIDNGTGYVLEYLL